MATRRGGSKGRRRLIAAVASTAAFGSLLVFGYNPEQDDVNSTPVPTHWPGTPASVTWSLNPTITGSHVAAGSDVRTALKNAFATWQNAQINGRTVVQLTITEGADTTLQSTDPVSSSDCVNIVSFLDKNATTDFPMSTGAIAFTALATAFGAPPFFYQCISQTSPPATTTKQCPLQSCIIDADILFNPNQQFSTAPSTPANAFDVQSVATHEIGHLLGLDHSGIAHTVMYPFGDTGQSQQSTLAIDDEAGMGFTYPATAFASATGTISGQVTMGASGIFASHVVAIDTATGDAVIDGLTNPDGTYKLIGLPPATYNVVALPLAPDVNSGIYTLSDFGGWSCGYAGTMENSPPCCDPAVTSCSGAPEKNPTNYTGKFF